MIKLFICGNLTREPELSETSNGIQFARLSIATDRLIPDKNGNKVTDFFVVTVWKKQAENCVKYLSKGSCVLLTGTLNNVKYKDQNGDTKYKIEIIADEVKFVGGKVKKIEKSDTQIQIVEEDLPF